MRYVVFILAVVAALIVAGCGGGGQPAAQPPPAGPSGAQPAAPPSEGQEIEVTMSEFKFEMTPAQVKAGKIRFELKNVGAVEHTFVIEGAGKGTEQIQPGQGATLEVELAPGTYTVICDVAGHKEAGMTMELVVK